MTVDELEARLAQLPDEIEKDDADLDALDAEFKGITAELEARKAAAAKKAELRAAVATGAGATITEIPKEERKTMTNAEVRASHEYNVAYANYIKTGNDAECRALLTENVSGTVPVASYVEGRVRTAWDREGITSRVRKTFLKGNVKIGYEISATGAIVHTEAANTAVTEETLTLGIVSLVPQSIKKWISISDEVYDLAGEEFLDYIYDELTYRIAKKLADAIIADIEACGTASTGSLPAVPKITSTTVTPHGAHSRPHRQKATTVTIPLRVFPSCSTTQSPHSPQLQPALHSRSLAIWASAHRLTSRMGRRSRSNSMTRPKWNTT